MFLSVFNKKSFFQIIFSGMSWVVDKKLAKKAASESAHKTQKPQPTTLYDHIQQDLSALAANHEKIETKQKEIDQTEQEISECKGKLGIRRKRELSEQLTKLQKEIDALRDHKERKEYEEKVRPYLQEYQRQRDLVAIEDLAGIQPFHDTDEPDEKQTVVSARSIKKRKSVTFGNFVMWEGKVKKRSRTAGASEEIIADYARNLQGKAPTIKIVQDDICEDCGERMLLVQSFGIMSCGMCGASRRYMDTTSASVGYGEDVEFTSFAYQRSNHFNEWLIYFQAKENTQIPIETTHKVMEYLYNEGITNPKTITMKKTLEVLKALNMRNLYKQNTQLWCLITGNPPPRMTPQQEEQCKLMFKAIQAPFEKHKPTDRRNFLSYPYCLYKFNELLGYTDFLKYFTLLKGPDKLVIQDDIFEKICQEMDWDFKRSR